MGTIAAIAQLGERQTEDLKVPGSIPGLGTFESHPQRIPDLCYRLKKAFCVRRKPSARGQSRKELRLKGIAIQAHGEGKGRIALSRAPVV